MEGNTLAIKTHVELKLINHYKFKIIKSEEKKKKTITHQLTTDTHPPPPTIAPWFQIHSPKGVVPVVSLQLT
jgi:hypothetical protein